MSIPDVVLLSAEGLLAESKSKTSLESFGSDDFREGFERFVESINAQQAVPPELVGPLERYIVRLLMNRQWFAKDLEVHPEIRDEELLPAVAIVALPRTGTSKLQRILGSTDSFQNLLFWHVHMFARIPGAVNGGKAERLEETKAYERWILHMVPDFMQGHPMHAEETEEEINLTDFTFRAPQLGIRFGAIEYLQWAATTDITPTYDYLKLQLQYLQWQLFREHPKPWLLKSPMHLGYEHQLLRLFPQGIKFICPHRSPAQLIASVARTTELFQQCHLGRIERDITLGPMVLQAFAAELHAHMAWRDQNPTVPILDIGFEELSTNSLATAAKVHDFLDLTLSDDAKTQIAEWDRHNPRNQHGENIATLEMYGLTEEMVDAQFRAYSDRFSDFF